MSKKKGKAHQKNIPATSINKSETMYIKNQYNIENQYNVNDNKESSDKNTDWKTEMVEGGKRLIEKGKIKPWQFIVGLILALLIVMAVAIIKFFEPINALSKVNKSQNVETIYSSEDVYTSEDNEEPTSEEISSVIEKEQIIADLESNTPQNFLEQNSIEVELEEGEFTLENSWIMFEIPAFAKEAPEQERIAAYTAFYNEIIEERRRTIDSDEKISKEYIEFVLAANETFEEYDENANYDIKRVIIDKASDQRFGAREECRQVSNEQILANWYALCGKNSFEEEYVNEEFVYFNYAIDMYLDAYAVSLVKSEIPKITALDYTSTCFLNIYNNVQLSDDIRMEALYSAASFDMRYKEMLSEYDENPKQMNQKEHGVCMDLGEIYIWLCKEAEQEDKLYYYQLASDTLLECRQYRYFEGKLSKRVYNDLMYLNQYCFDNVKQEYFTEDITRDLLYQRHREYENLLERN